MKRYLRKRPFWLGLLFCFLVSSLIQVAFYFVVGELSQAAQIIISFGVGYFGIEYWMSGRVEE